MLYYIYLDLVIVRCVRLDIKAVIYIKILQMMATLILTHWHKPWQLEQEIMEPVFTCQHLSQGWTIELMAAGMFTLNMEPSKPSKWLMLQVIKMKIEMSASHVHEITFSHFPSEYSTSAIVVLTLWLLRLTTVLFLSTTYHPWIKHTVVRIKEMITK